MGLIKTIAKLSMVVGIFMAGYSVRSMLDRKPYEIRHQHGEWHVLDQTRNISQLITPNFQLGSIEYRVLGLFEERERDFNDIQSALEKAAINYNLTR